MNRAWIRRLTSRRFPAGCPTSPRVWHEGFAALEFALVSSVVMLAVVLSVQTAYWQLHAQILQLAALEAARAGSLDYARPETLAFAFERALTPLFVPAGPDRTPATRQRVTWARQQQGEHCRLAPWRIRVTSPNRQTFADFQQTCRLHGHPHAGPCLLRSDLAGQHRRNQVRWGPSGRGPRSGQTVFDANQLNLDIRYLDTPLFPMMRAMLRQLAPLAGSTELAQAWRCGKLPIRVKVGVLMQTDTPIWPDSQPGATMGKGWVLHD